MSVSVARTAASRLRKETGASPPVDVVELVKWHGIHLSYEESWPDTLCARYYAATREIAINRGHARVRQRFSMAHELGHFILGHEGVDIEDRIADIFGDEGESYDVSSDLEREANAFATELLMPKDWVMQQDGSHSTALLVSVIRRGCDVSEPAAWYRVMELKLADFGSSPRRRR